jgi:hypothetical protein
MGFIRQQFVQGSLIFRDDVHSKRWIDAFGQNVTKYINDFTSGPATDAGFDSMGEWIITRVEGGAGESTITRIDGVGGKLRITSDAADNDGINMQLAGEAFKLETTRQLYFGAFGVTLSEATQSDFFLGLAITDTDILGGVTDRIGFEKLDASTAVGFMVEKNSTETKSSSLHTAVDATSFDLEFFYDGATAELFTFINGASVTAPAITNLPDDEELSLSLQFLAGSVNAKTFDVDLIRVIQIGR